MARPSGSPPAPPLAPGALGTVGWRRLAMAGALLTHAVVLRGDLLDADRLLLVHDPEVRTFSGLAAMLAGGEPVVRATWLLVRDRAPLGVLSTWLGWQWFRGSPWMQHALGIAALLAAVAALVSLLRALSAPPAIAGLAGLLLALHPCAADLTGPILGRPPLLAAALVLFAARRAHTAGLPGAVAWSAGAAIAAGLLVPGWGLLGLIPAAVITAPRVRPNALLAAAVAALAALAVTVPPPAGALGEGAAAVIPAWLPAPLPFVVATAGSSAWAVPAVLLAAAALAGARRASGEPAAGLLRAGGAAMLASLLASAASWRAGTVSGSAAFAFHLGVVLALAGVVCALHTSILGALRPWMLLALAVPAGLTAYRAAAWADDDRVLEATAALDPGDPEAMLALGRIALRGGRLDLAERWCLRYGEAAPATFRADGCLAVVALARGDEGAAVALLRRWAGRFDDRRALRAAVLELSEARPDPRFASVFGHATGFAMPSRRPGEHR